MKEIYLNWLYSDLSIFAVMPDLPSVPKLSSHSWDILPIKGNNNMQIDVGRYHGQHFNTFLHSLPIMSKWACSLMLWLGSHSLSHLTWILSLPSNTCHHYPLNLYIFPLGRPHSVPLISSIDLHLPITNNHSSHSNSGVLPWNTHTHPLTMSQPFQTDISLLSNVEKWNR